MKVYLLDPKQIVPAVWEHARGCYHQIAACVPLSGRGDSQQIDSPADADVILAPVQGGGYGPFFTRLRRSELFRKHAPKVVCYCPDDLVYPALPGIYPAVTPFSARTGWAVGGHYVSSHIHQHNFAVLPPDERDILFSFVGSSKTHPLRERVMQLEHRRALLADSTAPSESAFWFERGESVRQEMFARYEAVLGRTKFALCPRGVSASSIRLFEAIEAGCVPIIIADDLVLPDGPRWDEFSVRVREADLSSIPQRLEQLEPEFDRMTVAARQAWEDFFSPAATFQQLCRQAEAIQQALQPLRRLGLAAAARAGEFLLPRNLRIHLRHSLRRGSS